MNANRMLLAAVLTLLPLAGQAETYRWVDSEGKVHYSDTPPPAAAKKIQKKALPGSPAGTQQLPYELQQAARNFPVTLYVTDCGESCSRARQLLAKRGIPYTELDPSDAATYEALKKAAGGTAVVPLIVIGRQALKGFDEQGWNSALDVAGYPKSAVAKITPTRPPKPAAQPPAQGEDAEQSEEAGEVKPPAENPDNADEG
jgi:glutaredoxin